jgi:hypothetical protein
MGDIPFQSDPTTDIRITDSRPVQPSVRLVLRGVRPAVTASAAATAATVAARNFRMRARANRSQKLPRGTCAYVRES